MELKMKPYYEDESVTIYNADCREVLPTLDKVDLVLTDPPYGIGLEYGEDVDDSQDTHFEWFATVLPLLIESGAATVFTHRQEAVRHIEGWNKLAIWNKPMSFGFARGGWLPHWEPIFIYGNLPTKGVPDVFNINPAKPNGHPAPKPVELMSKIMVGFNAQTILDPFMGSGTTLRAAKDLNRKAIGIEIEERYCEIAAKRMSQLAMAL